MENLLTPFTKWSCDLAIVFEGTGKLQKDADLVFSMHNNICVPLWLSYMLVMK